MKSMLDIILEILETSKSSITDKFIRMFDACFSVYDWYTEKQKLCNENLPKTLEALFNEHMAEIARMDIEKQEWEAYQEWLSEHSEEQLSDEEFDEEVDKLYCPF